jgi:hypothetical protein
MKHIAAGLAVLVLAGATGAGGYAIGRRGGADVEAARLAGTREGTQQGFARGTRAGYQEGFRRARKRAYKVSFERARKRAYRQVLNASEAQ